METLQRITPTPPQSTKQYWIKVYLKDPFSIQFLGPFSSPDEAQNAKAETSSQGQTVVSSFPIQPCRPPIPIDSPMSHPQWLQRLMEDYLHVTVP